MTKRGATLAVEVDEPARQSSACVFSSPHSGRHYPADFVAQSRLDPMTLRRSEDSFVDELFAAAPDAGAILVKAHYPRAYVDVNRGPFELDPVMFSEPLPTFADSSSERVAGGLGTIPRVVGAGVEIYGRAISYAEAERRINEIYYPFHQRLAAVLSATREKFGLAVLIDCHSMPSSATMPNGRHAKGAPDVVLGDRFGTSCALAISDLAESALKRVGLRVARNDPYAGGYNTRSYGRPEKGVHALQIEIARALYMDETKITKHDGFGRLRTALAAFVHEFTAGVMELPRTGDGWSNREAAE